MSPLGSPLVHTSLVCCLGRAPADPVHPAAAAEGGGVGEEGALLPGHTALRSGHRDELEAGRVDTVPADRGGGGEQR